MEGDGAVLDGYFSSTHFIPHLESPLHKGTILPGCAVVLQKHEEDHQERSFAVLQLRLDGHSEQFCDERCLAQAVSSVHPLHLSFSDHIHRLISL